MRLCSFVLSGSETMIWKENERPMIRAVRMDSLRGLLRNRRMDRVPNPQISKMCRVTKGVDERIEESVL